VDLQLLLKEMRKWVDGNWYEKRAVAAALAEPRLLKDANIAHEVLIIFDRITSEMESAQSPALNGQSKGRADDAFRVLRQAMGYCWSVAVVALPEEGKPMMEKWLSSHNHDIQWIMRENLKKNRLTRMNENWVGDCWQRLQQI